MSQECSDFYALPEHTTHFGCLSNQNPNGTALQKTMIKGHISFRSGDTEEGALEAAVQFHETLKIWIREIYHPEQETLCIYKDVTNNTLQCHPKQSTNCSQISSKLSTSD